MDDIHELTNVRVIRVTTQAALSSTPHLADAHRRRAAQLLDDAEQRTVSPRVQAEIAAVRRQLIDVVEERERPGEG